MANADKEAIYSVFRDSPFFSMNCLIGFENRNACVVGRSISLTYQIKMNVEGGNVWKQSLVRSVLVSPYAVTVVFSQIWGPRFYQLLPGPGLRAALPPVLVTTYTFRKIPYHQLTYHKHSFSAKALRSVFWQNNSFLLFVKVESLFRFFISFSLTRNVMFPQMNTYLRILSLTMHLFYWKTILLFCTIFSSASILSDYANICLFVASTYSTTLAVTCSTGIISHEARRRLTWTSICFQFFHALAIGALAIWNDSTTKWNWDTGRSGTSQPMRRLQLPAWLAFAGAGTPRSTSYCCYPNNRLLESSFAGCKLMIASPVLHGNQH